MKGLLTDHARLLILRAMNARTTTRYYGYRYYAAPATGARGGRLRA